MTIASKNIIILPNNGSEPPQTQLCTGVIELWLLLQSHSRSPAQGPGQCQWKKKLRENGHEDTNLGRFSGNLSCSRSPLLCAREAIRDMSSCMSATISCGKDGQRRGERRRMG